MLSLEFLLDPLLLFEKEYLLIITFGLLTYFLMMGQKLIFQNISFKFSIIYLLIVFE
jgi:hypothetical protein